MNLDNVFKKTRQIVSRKGYIAIGENRPEVPQGLLRKCNKCGDAIIAEDAIENYYICPKCGGYFRVDAYSRIARVADEGTFEEWDKGLVNGNPMEFKGYEAKVAALQEKTGLDEAVVTGAAKIDGRKVVLGICDGRFMMASMGRVVGEKIARAVERATEEKLPVILFACSGGARMQEGIISLMQMAKTAAALKRHSDAGLLYISVLTDPTTGGVTASFAMLGDIILAEPKALIGFAGPRVIEQTIGQKLPKGFQRAEFLLEHGFIDGIVERANLRGVLGHLLEMHAAQASLASGVQDAEEAVAVEVQSARETIGDVHTDETPARAAAAMQDAEHIGVLTKERENVRPQLDPWERVKLSRRNDRPVADDYIRMLFDGFTEFHGDRCFKDDQAVIGGIAMFHGRPVTVIAQAKGTNTKENIAHNFGMPSPEGYRKAVRLMRQAEKFHRPVICLVDTPGAFCGIEAEERGQGEAIARSIYEMSALKTPVVSIVIGEGGSGGALAMATSDEVWMLENSVYSILSPEGFASILWKDAAQAKDAAAVMKLTAQELKKQGVVDLVFEEPDFYTAANMEPVVQSLRQELLRFLEQYTQLDENELTEGRYRRFRSF